MNQRPGNRIHALLHAGSLVEYRLRERLNEAGLGPRQARVLSALNRMGETHQKTLAREFAITPASMSSMCDRLATAGLIERHVDPNEKRAFLIRLTPKGESKVKDVHAAWDDVDMIIVDVMGEEEANSLADLSGKLRDQLGGTIPGLSMKEKYDG